MTTTPSPADPLFDNFLVRARGFARGDASAAARVAGVAGALRNLVQAGWQMPDPRYCAMQADAPYGSWLLYLDPHSQLSVVLDVFGQGQVAAIHNHACWGAFACLAGAERERQYRLEAGVPVEVGTRLMQPGDVAVVDPPGDAFHQVECASTQASTSLHVYGRDIGRIERQRWDGTGFIAFRSAYSNDALGLAPYRLD
ncbi:MAG: cysteine dioxygenase family protein [Rhodoferax sp.]|jgi:predicted metal-dependent enzyme (double-stranded beta helix superfamily)|nr:cysteine dioxygenase family protein [Rhodoferax sp.]